VIALFGCGAEQPTQPTNPVAGKGGAANGGSAGQAATAGVLGGADSGSAGRGGSAAGAGGSASGGAASTGGVSGGTASGGSTPAGGTAGAVAGGDGGGGDTGGGGNAGTVAGGEAGTAGASGSASLGGAGGTTAGTSGAGGSSAGSGGGPNVDRTNPRLHEFNFPPEDADAEAQRALGDQYAYLDTRVAGTGKLVIYLHGAGDFGDCGNGALGTLVAGWGFHWFAPCYLSNYGVDNCGNDIEGCRLEAFEGTDHHSFVQIGPADSIERRVVRGLRHLQELNPQGDWDFFVDGEQPRWSSIVITGHSHGASTSAVIGMHRRVSRVVSLAGPHDPGQAWLSGTPLTPRDAYYGFTHSGDGQHQGHLAAYSALGLPGEPTRVDGAAPPYSGSHRLYSSAGVGDAHQSVTSGNIAAFVEVWRYLYGAP
jgi:hypothetical protein